MFLVFSWAWSYDEFPFVLPLYFFPSSTVHFFSMVNIFIHIVSILLHISFCYILDYYVILRIFSIQSGLESSIWWLPGTIQLWCGRLKRRTFTSSSFNLKLIYIWSIFASWYTAFLIIMIIVIIICIISVMLMIIFIIIVIPGHRQQQPICAYKPVDD